MQNVPENSVKTSLLWLHSRTKQTRDPSWRKQGWMVLNSSKDDFLMKSFPFSTKRKLSILLNFLFPFFVFERFIFNLEMQNSCLKTSAWWSRSSHFVENGYPSLRFPNMVNNNYSPKWRWLVLVGYLPRPRSGEVNIQY